MRSPAQLLVVSPDTAVLQAARRSLASLDHSPLFARSLGQARRMLNAADIDLLCLDGTFEIDEIESFWRAAFDGRDRTPPSVIFLSARPAKAAPVALPAFFQPKRDGLLQKPLEDEALVRELTRLAAARARRERRAAVLRAGSLVLDGTTRQLRLANGGTLPLTPTEFRLMRRLMQRPGMLVSPDELLEKVWGYPPGTGGREVLRAHVSNVRRKLRLLGEDPRLLRGIPFRGYSIVPDERPRR